MLQSKRSNPYCRYGPAELIAMRTKPALGFIPRVHDDMFVMDTFTYKLIGTQFAPSMMMNDLWEVAKSLIYHGPIDLVLECAKVTKFDTGSRGEKRVRLCLAMELYSSHTQILLTLTAITCAYGGRFLVNDREELRAHACNVWKWMITEYAGTCSSGNYDEFRGFMERYRPMVVADAELDKQAVKQLCNAIYSNQTLQKFIEHLVPNAAPPYINKTVEEYVTSMRFGGIPLEVREFVATHSGCIECAMAKVVGRVCTRVHKDVSKPMDDIDTLYSKDVYVVFANAPAPIHAYFAPPQPSAPPMDEINLR